MTRAAHPRKGTLPMLSRLLRWLTGTGMAPGTVTRPDMFIRLEPGDEWPPTLTGGGHGPGWAKASPRAAGDALDERLGLDPVLATIPGTAAYGVRLGRTVAIGDLIRVTQFDRMTVRARRFFAAELEDRLLQLRELPRDHGPVVWLSVSSARYLVVVAPATRDDTIAHIEALGYVVRRHRYALDGFATVIDRERLRDPITNPFAPGIDGWLDIAPLEYPRELGRDFAYPPTIPDRPGSVLYVS